MIDLANQLPNFKFSNGLLLCMVDYAFKNFSEIPKKYTTLNYNILRNIVKLNQTYCSNKIIYRQKKNSFTVSSYT